MFELGMERTSIRNRNGQPITLTITYLEIPHMYDFGLREEAAVPAENPRIHRKNKPPPSLHCTKPQTRTITAKSLIQSFPPKHNLKTRFLTLNQPEVVRTRQIDPS